MLLFRENDAIHFGRLDSALMSIWQVETLDNWDDMMTVNMLGCFHNGHTVVGLHSHRCLHTNPLGWWSVLFFVVMVRAAAAAASPPPPSSSWGSQA